MQRHTTKMNKYKRINTITAFLLIFSDILSLIFAMSFAFWIKFHSGILNTSLGVPSFLQYFKAFLITTFLFVFIFRHYKLYHKEALPVSIINEFILINKAIITGMFTIMALTFIYREVSYSRSMVFLFAPISIVTTTITRYIVRKIELHLCRKNNIFKRIAIIGSGPTALKLIDNINTNVRLKYKTVGIITHQKDEKTPENIAVLGEIKNLKEIIQNNKINEVILTVSSLPHTLIEKMILECEKAMVSFKLVPDMFEMLTNQVNILNFGGISLLGIAEPPLHQSYNRLMKKIMDLFGAGFGLIILSPLLLIITLLIKITSKGPVIYKQKRYGEDGRIFTVYKFRTMCQGADDEGPMWTKKADPRRTKIGSFLRATNIDELPQLYNVLKGEMSLVGPRPEQPHFVDQFKENIPRYMSRHLIKSGLTGWAQVNGLRGDTSIEERIKYDLYYIENWSVLLDIKILIMTLFARKNAY